MGPVTEEGCRPYRAVSGFGWCREKRWGSDGSVRWSSFIIIISLFQLHSTFYCFLFYSFSLLSATLTITCSRSSLFRFITSSSFFSFKIPFILLLSSSLLLREFLHFHGDRRPQFSWWRHLIRLGMFSNSYLFLLLNDLVDHPVQSRVISPFHEPREAHALLLQAFMSSGWHFDSF